MYHMLYDGEMIYFAEKKDKIKWFVGGLIFGLLGMLVICIRNRKEHKFIRKAAFKWSLYGCLINTVPYLLYSMMMAL